MSIESRPKPFFSHPRKFYSSLIWILAAIFVFYKFMMVVTPSVMIRHLTEAFHINATQLGLLAGSYFYAFFLFQIPSGVLIDRFGTRHVTALGILIYAAGVLTFSLSQNLAVACLGRFIMGIGGTFAVLTVLKLSLDWFHYTYFAFLNGLMMTFGMTGAIMGQAPFNYVFNLFGWRTTILDISLFGFILAIVFWVVVRDNETTLAFKLQPIASKVSYKKALKRLFVSRESWCLFFYSGLTWTTVTVFAGFWGTPFLKIQYHLGDQPAPFVNSLLFFGFAFGAPFFGWLSNDMGKRKPLLFAGTIATLVFFLTAVYVPGIPTPYIALFFFLIGFCSSTFLLSFPLMAEIHPRIIAITALAFLNCGNALFGALADPLVGLFLDIDTSQEVVFSAKNFSHVLFRLPFYLLISIILLCFIPETHCKPRYK